VGKKVSGGKRPGPVVYDPANDPLGRTVANWMFPGYLGLILVGFWMIRWVGFPTGARSGVRALFFAVNAATLTGFDLSNGISGLNRYGQFVVLILIISGSLFSMMVGSLAVTRIVRLPFNDDQVIFSAVIVEIAAVAAGTLALLPGRAVFEAVFLAASAFGNCGLYLGNLPGDSSLATHLVVLPLGIIGGIGLPVLMEIFRAVFGRQPMSNHSRGAIAMSAWIYVVGFVLLLAVSLAMSGSWNVAAAEQVIRGSSILAVESRTGGLPIYPVRLVNQSGQWILILLMVIGASPAGTGGGLKTTTVVELVRGTRRILAGESVGRSFGVALTWLGIYGGIVLGGVILFSSVNPTPTFDGSLMNAVSGASNVGFSIAPLPDAQNVMYAHCAIMLLGRFTPLMVLWWMADSTRGAELAIG
jgi:trk system potassium uptake protein